MESNCGAVPASPILRLYTVAIVAAYRYDRDDIIRPRYTMGSPSSGTKLPSLPANPRTGWINIPVQQQFDYQTSLKTLGVSKRQRPYDLVIRS